MCLLSFVCKYTEHYLLPWLNMNEYRRHRATSDMRRSWAIYHKKIAERRCKDSERRREREAKSQVGA